MNEPIEQVTTVNPEKKVNKTNMNEKKRKEALGEKENAKYKDAYNH